MCVCVCVCVCVSGHRPLRGVDPKLPETLNPTPDTVHPKPQTPNPKHETPNPNPSCCPPSQVCVFVCGGSACLGHIRDIIGHIRT